MDNIYSMTRSVYFLLLLLLSIVVSEGQRASEGNTIILHLTDDFELEGEGNATAWNSTEWVSVEYRAGKMKSYKTQVKLLYSATGLYCLFRCEDKKIVSTLKEDFADLWNEDVVELFIWPDESIPLYFEYELSPHNFELPIMVPNIDGRFYGWRPWNYEGPRKIRHQTHISSKEWTAEFFIPYSMFHPLGNVPPAKGTKWRGNFYRLDYDKGPTRWSWQKTEGNFHDYKNFGVWLFE